jgi:glycerol-3-phosphate dehydrogenase
VAEETLKKLKPFITWQIPVSTKNYPLPGGDLSLAALKVLEKKLIRDYPFIEACIIRRWISQWGSETESFLKNVATLEDLGKDFGSGLYAFEIDIFIKHFFAKTAEDVLFRLTRLKSGFTQEQIQVLDHYMAK